MWPGGLRLASAQTLFRCLLVYVHLHYAMRGSFPDEVLLGPRAPTVVLGQ